MRKKNILFMAQLPPPVHGAALRNKSLLDSPLINADFNINPLPLRFIDNMQDLGKFSLKKIFLMLIYCCQLLRALAMKKIDLVYFTMSPQGGAFYRDILFMTLIKLFRKKAVLHFRVKGIKKTAGSRLGKKLVRFAFHRSDVICLSHHHLEDLAGLTFRKPFIVPNGIRIESGRSRAIAESTGPVSILFLSNLSTKKGIPDLIHALEILKNRGYAFIANLVGNQWDLSFSDVQGLVDSGGLNDRVTICGPKFGAEKIDYLQKADLFVFPTYFELFPGVVLEAMQFGKAIVSTFEGSIPEIIDNGVNGILVEQRNVEQLADAIAFMIDHPGKRKEMGLLAEKKFFANFTLEIFEKRMNAVFHEVLRTPSAENE